MAVARAAAAAEIIMWRDEGGNERVREGAVISSIFMMQFVGGCDGATSLCVLYHVVRSANTIRSVRPAFEVHLLQYNDYRP